MVPLPRRALAHATHQSAFSGAARVSLVWSCSTPMCIPPQSSCDADEVTVTERNGLLVDFGRVRRVITPRRHSRCGAINGAGARGCSVPSAHPRALRARLV